MSIKRIKAKFFIKTKRYSIRPIRISDANINYKKWFDGINDKFIQDSQKKEVTLNYLKEYIKRSLNTKNEIFLAVFTKKGKHIGNIKFLKIDLKTKTSNLGIWIGDKNYQKKGVASETLSESINFIFNKKLVNKFVLGVCVANLKAIKLYKKLGFKKKSKINNVLNMSLTKINFYKNYQNYCH